MRTPHLIGLLLACAGAVMGQEEAADEKSALPPGPWPGEVGDFARWVVESKFTNPLDKDAGIDPAKLEVDTRMAAIDVTKTRNVIRERVEDELGRRGESWLIGERQVTADIRGGKLRRMTSALEGYRDYGARPFPELSWVRPERYTGVRTVLGKKCAVFEHDGATAAIDLETRRPVAMTTAEAAVTYKFLEAPQAVLSPPAAFAAELAAWERESRRIIVRPPRP